LESKTLKIGLVLSNPPQASETFLNSFIEILKREHNLILFVSRKSNNSISQKQYLGLNRSSFFKSPYFLILLLFNYKRYSALRKLNIPKKQLIADLQIWTTRNFDYLHFGFGNLIFGREYYGQVMGCKTSISFRGSDINVYPVWHKKSYSLALSLTNKIQVNSTELLNKLELHHNDIRKKAEIIHPGLQRLYAATNKEIVSFFEQRLQNKVLEIVSVGRLHWIKGYETILASLGLYKKQGNDFRYTIVGAGIESEKLNYLINFYDLTENVHLVSQKSPEEIKGILQVSNLFIQTSWAEGFSNSTLEAQALGLPVVVTPVSGMSTIVQHKITGYITKDFSPEEVLNGLHWFKNLTADDMKQLSVIASEHVQVQFSFDRLKQKWLSFFN
jgi:colanic acid/amylovoran biosynthesis glycosyltransferase